MSAELVYTDGACSNNGKKSAFGGFGMFIARSRLFGGAFRLNRKGEAMMVNGRSTPVTNIRMEGLAIVSTMALYARAMCAPGHPLEVLNADDPYYAAPPGAPSQPISGLEIVTDSQFWINVATKWMPTWIRKGILLDKKNPDILQLLHQYQRWYAEHGVPITLTFVNSHQRGNRTAHADGNDMADVLATSAARTSDAQYHQLD